MPKVRQAVCGRGRTSTLVLLTPTQCLIFIKDKVQEGD